MKIIKENLIEIFLLIGMMSMSIGFFVVSPIIGFIATGILFIFLAAITHYFKEDGGD